MRTRTKKRVPASCTVPWNQGGSKQAGEVSQSALYLSSSLSQLEHPARSSWLGNEKKTYLVDDDGRGARPQELEH